MMKLPELQALHEIALIEVFGEQARKWKIFALRYFADHASLSNPRRIDFIYLQ
jgi:hypothetical protein